MVYIRGATSVGGLSSALLDELTASSFAQRHICQMPGRVDDVSSAGRASRRLTFNRERACRYGQQGADKGPHAPQQTMFMGLAHSMTSWVSAFCDADAFLRQAAEGCSAGSTRWLGEVLPDGYHVEVDPNGVA